jgi:hypothetical protein
MKTCRERTVDRAKTAMTSGRTLADPTQEVAAIDILEETPLEEIPIDIDLSPAPGPPSISPLSVSVLPAPRRAAESTFRIDAVPSHGNVQRRRLGAVVTGAMGLSVCILLAAGVRARMNEPLDQTAVAAALPAVLEAPAAAAQPWRTAASDAPATSGTVTSRGGALFIDGARISAKSALVSCGHHQLRVGRSKARDVDVPCGGTLVVDRAGRTSVQAAR